MFSEPDEIEIVVGGYSEAGIAFDKAVAVFTGGLDGSHGEAMVANSREGTKRKLEARGAKRPS